MLGRRHVLIVARERDVRRIRVARCHQAVEERRRRILKQLLGRTCGYGRRLGEIMILERDVEYVADLLSVRRTGDRDCKKGYADGPEHRCPPLRAAPRAPHVDNRDVNVRDLKGWT